MIPVREAFQRIVEAMPSAPTREIPLEAAAGHWLREDVAADRDAPPFDRVMLDGVALNMSALNAGQRRFRIAGSAPAGAPAASLPAADLCLEVMTGAPLPAGTDTIVPLEDLRCQGDWIEVTARPAAGQGIHPRASQAHAGDRVLASGIRIDPAAMAVLATEGKTRVRIAAPPRICLLTTGDEIVPFNGRPLAHQIRASHPLTLQSLLAAHGYRQWTHLHTRDEKSELTRVLREGLEETDVLLITGGVSKGAKDWVPEILERIGVPEVFHGVAQRPGKPLWFGVKGRQAVFALPGNPLSALTCARRYLLPALEMAATGRAEPPLHLHPAEAPNPHPALTTFPLVFRENGNLFPRPAVNSGALHAAAGSAGFLECPPGDTPPASFAFYSWTGH